MAGKKSKSIDTSLRIMKVAKYMLSGYSKRVFLLQIISENEEWDVSERQLDNYIKDAKEIIINSNSELDLKFEKDLAINRLEGLYAMNMKINDFREARVVTLDRMKLMGLLVDKQEIKQQQEINVNQITTTEIKKIKEELGNDF